MNATAASRGPRLALLLSGSCALFWLALEDQALWPPLALGAALASLLTLQFLLGRLRGRQPGPVQIVSLGFGGGLVAGTGACLCAVGLMMFKNASHAHSIPDFPGDRLLATLQLAPQMALSFALTGLGISLVCLLLRERAPSPPNPLSLRERGRERARTISNIVSSPSTGLPPLAGRGAAFAYMG